MRTNDFDYDLPPELIARRPIARRDGCRLLWVGRNGNVINEAGINGSPVNNAGRINNTGGGSAFKHLLFRDILTILRPGDRLVFNDTRVIPARLFCVKEGTGAAIELFFTERAREDGRTWKALVKPAKRVPAGTVLAVDGEPRIKIRVDEVTGDGYERLVSLVSPTDSCIGNNGINGSRINTDGLNNIGTIDAVIDTYGHLPLPHYMERDGDAVDDEMYQTVYADRPGAVAAPTAGLHFTRELLDELAAMGVDRSFVTLHVGIGTFRPVQADDPREHDIHEERFEFGERAVGEINATWDRGGRVIAVGTTAVRVLESCAVSRHEVAPKGGRTKLMILPPYEFKAVDGLITNFHLPKSTLLMLVSAFADRATVLSAYREAVERGYRLVRYGDAMAII
jgi:S-adenosylmethionine:tRNA ribosyltransferase-isomerase